MFKIFLLLALLGNVLFPEAKLPEKFNDKINSILNESTPERNTGPDKVLGGGWDIKASPIPSKPNQSTHQPQAAASLSADLLSNQILASTNIDRRLPIASLTKLMTAYIILRENKLDEVFTVPSLEIRSGDSLAGLKPGEKITVKALLYGLLINSGNDAAQTLAINNADSINGFVKKMNLTAKNLSLTNTNYSNPVGWDDPNNYSSAKDMYTLSRILLNNSDFRNITSLRLATVYTITGRPIPLVNTNLLLGGDGVVGLKTGYTPISGECLVALDKFENHEIITVILGSNDRFGQTKNYLDWIKSSFTW